MRYITSGILLSCLAGTLPASAQTPTIDKINERGEIVIGHRPASPPFSFLDEKGQATGYSVDVCKYVAAYIQNALKRPDIKVKYVPADPSNGIPLVQNGTIDMECAGTGNTLERQKVVAFTLNIFYTRTEIAARKDAIKDAAGLKDKNVAVLQGTVQQRMLAVLDKDQNLNIKPVLARDTAEAYMLFESGRADAVINDPLLLSAYIAKSPNPSSIHYVPGWKTAATPATPAISIVVNKSDEKFRSLANEAIKDMIASGAFEKNYDKWFKVAPYNMEMPDPLRQQMKAPNDNGI